MTPDDPAGLPASGLPAPGGRRETIESPPDEVLTIGHSNRSFDEFLELLRAHHVTLVVDVRTMPGSRHNPQFNRETLILSLHHAGIDYVHLKGLGGRRRKQKDSPNQGWKNASFQGYADYMQTAEFEESIEQLMRRVQGQRAVLMCAEAVPWRCHRSLIADALTVRGISVADIFSATRTRPHVLKPWARVQGTRITYPEHEEGGPATA
jgi:uncharacterized protein (DUF488 family)